MAVKPDSDVIPCPACGGTGVDLKFVTRMACDACGGSGMTKQTDVFLARDAFDATHWRLRAEEVCTIAEEMIDSEAKAIAFRIADDYERLARKMEPCGSPETRPPLTLPVLRSRLPLDAKGCTSRGGYESLNLPRHKGEMSGIRKASSRTEPNIYQSAPNADGLSDRGLWCSDEQRPSQAIPGRDSPPPSDGRDRTMTEPQRGEGVSHANSENVGPGVHRACGNDPNCQSL